MGKEEPGDLHPIITEWGVGKGMRGSQARWGGPWATAWLSFYETQTFLSFSLPHPVCKQLEAAALLLGTPSTGPVLHNKPHAGIWGNYSLSHADAALGVQPWAIRPQLDAKNTYVTVYESPGCFLTSIGLFLFSSYNRQGPAYLLPLHTLL
jgi:hypothetical protein